MKNRNIKIEIVEDYGDMELISSSGADGDLIYMEDGD